MRRLFIAAVAAAVVVAGPAPAKAQVVVGDYPPYIAPYPRFVAPFPGGAFPGNSGVIPWVNGGPVEYALNTALRALTWRGYGPYAAYGRFPAQLYYGSPYPAYYGPWNAYGPYAVPAPKGKWVDPWPGNNGWHKGWYKSGGGKGGGKGGKGGGKGGKGGKGR
jgi:hypothetical protein